MEDAASTAAILAGAVSRDGVAFLPGSYVRSLLPPSGFYEFEGAWNNLGADEYLPGGATYRRRRYGRLLANPGSEGRYFINRMPLAAFEQSADLMPLYGGRPRMFEPIEERTFASSVLRSLVNLDLEVIASVEHSQNVWAVGVHMIRIVVKAGLCQLPAPEGRHADGHRYIAMHLIRRRDCEGGESRVFPARESEPVLETTLTDSLDTLIVDDRRVEHAVTAVRAVERVGTRDMLLVDFDPA
jgi:hypothetical protein